MKPKASSLVFWMIAGILLLGIVTLFFSNQKLVHQSPALPLLDFNMADVKSFTINNFTQGLQFTQSADGAWQITPQITELQKQLGTHNQHTITTIAQKADREKMIAFLTELSLIKVQTPVATQTKPEEFQINPMSLHITFYDATNQVLGTLFIGKKGFDQMSTYVMKAGTNGVYWIPQDIRSQAVMPMEFWLETNIP